MADKHSKIKRVLPGDKIGKVVCVEPELFSWLSFNDGQAFQTAGDKEPLVDFVALLKELKREDEEDLYD